MASNVTDDGFKCPICLETYQEPKALVCLHTFCETCINEYILKNKEKGLLSDGIECPLCRFVTPVEKDNPLETWAKSLRSNYALALVLESVSDTKKYSEQNEKFCQPCLKQNLTSTAAIFCSVCNERLCEDCKAVHDRLEFTKNHESVNIESKENVEFLTTFQTLQKCEQHGKKLKFFCKDEDTLCCSTCAIITHRECTGLVELSEIAHKFGNTRLCVQKELTELEIKMKSSTTHLVSESKKMTTQITDLVEELKQIREKVIKRFDILENKLTIEMKSLQNSKSTEIMQKAVGCEEVACEARRLMHILDLANKNGTQEQTFIVARKLKDLLAVQKSRADLKFKNLESLNLSLDVSTTMEDFLKSPELVSLSVESETEVIPSCTSKRLQLIANVDLKQAVGEEFEPYYYGIDFLPDGRVVAVDYYNKKCVVMNGELQKVGEISCKVNPLDVAVAENNTIIICTGYDKKLLVYQVNDNNTLIETQNVPVPVNCESISVVGNDTCIVGTPGHSEPVHKLSTSGSVTTLGLDFHGIQYAFCDEFKCCFEDETKQLLITDKEANAVFIYSLETGEMVTVKDERLVSPVGVSHYMNDLYFICCNDTASIMQLTSSGKMLAVDKLSMELPHSMCISKDKNRLLVSNNHKGSKILQLFRIV